MPTQPSLYLLVQSSKYAQASLGKQYALAPYPTNGATKYSPETTPSSLGRLHKYHSGRHLMPPNEMDLYPRKTTDEYTQAQNPETQMHFLHGVGLSLVRVSYYHNQT